MSASIIVDSILRILAEELIKYEPQIQKFLEEELEALGKILNDYLSEKLNLNKE